MSVISTVNTTYIPYNLYNTPLDTSLRYLYPYSHNHIRVTFRGELGKSAYHQKKKKREKGKTTHRHTEMVGFRAMQAFYLIWLVIGILAGKAGPQRG